MPVKSYLDQAGLRIFRSGPGTALMGDTTYVQSKHPYTHKKYFLDWGCCSVAEYFSSRYEAFGSSLSIRKEQTYYVPLETLLQYLLIHFSLLKMR